MMPSRAAVLSVLLSAVAGLAMLGIARRSAAAAPPAAAGGENIHALMVGELNPSLTDVSYTLFHQAPPGAEPTEELVAKLARLERAAQRLGRVPPPEEDSVAFQAHVVHLQVSVRALSEAVLTGETDVVHHAFNSLKATCTSCHARFR